MVAPLTLRPIDFALAADGRSERVLHLEPLIGAAREIGRAKPLAHNALTAERASMLVDDRAVAVVTRIERHAVVRRSQYPGEKPLALLDWLPPQVSAVYLQHIEDAQGRRMVVPAVTEQVKDGEAVLVNDDRLAIDDAGLDRQPPNGVYDQRIPLGEVVTVGCDKANAGTVLLRQDPEAIMLDFMNPVGPAGRLFRSAGQTSLE